MANYIVLQSKNCSYVGCLRHFFFFFLPQLVCRSFEKKTKTKKNPPRRPVGEVVAVGCFIFTVSFKSFWSFRVSWQEATRSKPRHLLLFVL